MFGSVVLDVAIGLTFLYLLLSLVCSALREAIEARLKSRASHLERGIREMLRDEQGEFAKRLYEHPLIYSLFKGAYEAPLSRSYTGGRWLPATVKSWARGAAPTALPSYIPARNFALALLDIVGRGDDANTSGPLSAPQLRAMVNEVQNPQVRSAVLNALDTAKGDLDATIRNVEAWYDSTMDRVSGWYKRETQHILFWLGLAVAVALNVNTISVVRHLATSETARNALVEQAVRAPTQADGATAEDRLEALSDKLQGLNLPIGWHVDVSGKTAVDVVTSIPGWLVTAFAITFGAPFWFDLLNKLMVIRSTVKPHEKSPEEASEDRQR